jgi:hypothetical protein
LRPVHLVFLLIEDQQGAKLIGRDLVQTNENPKVQRRPKIQRATDELPTL